MSSDRRTTMIIWSVAVGGLALRLYRFVHAGARTGIVGYDDGVYFGASVRLVHGSLPYRDFVFVHPPVITELFAPLAVLSPHLSTVSLVFAGRVLTALVSAATILLIGRLLRSRGPVAAGVGCALFAIHDDAVEVTRGTLIEPYLAFFVVLALVLLFDGDELASTRRTFWAGVVIGVAMATKIWAVVPAVVLVALCLRDRARIKRIVGGIVIGAVVPCLPFLIVAPGTFIHDILIAQFGRELARTSLAFRLAHLLGVSSVGSARSVFTIVVVLGFGVLLASGYWDMWKVARRRPTPFELAVVAGTVVTGVMFLVPAEFYWHYAAFFAPFLALAVALPAPRFAGRARVPSGAAWLAVGAVVLVLCLASTVRSLTTPQWVRAHAAAIDRALPAGTCTLTNDPSLALAVNRMPSSRSCRVIVDSVGTAFVKANGRQGRRAQSSPALQRVWLHAAHEAHAVLLAREWLRLVPMRALAPALRQEFRLVRTGDPHVLLYLRRGTR